MKADDSSEISLKTICLPVKSSRADIATMMLAEVKGHLTSNEKDSGFIVHSHEKVTAGAVRASIMLAYSSSLLRRASKGE